MTTLYDVTPVNMTMGTDGECIEYSAMLNYKGKPMYPLRTTAKWTCGDGIMDTMFWGDLSGGLKSQGGTGLLGSENCNDTLLGGCTFKGEEALKVFKGEC